MPGPIKHSDQVGVDLHQDVYHRSPSLNFDIPMLTM